jgi:hypothetical protein
MDPLSAGLIHMEINRGDGSLGTFMAVQAGLASAASSSASRWPAYRSSSSGWCGCSPR